MTAARDDKGRFTRRDPHKAIADMNRQMVITGITERAIREGRAVLTDRTINPAEAREIALAGLVLAADSVTRFRAGARA